MAQLQTIILAAGKGTRMKSDVPKVLHCLCGQSLIEHVIKAVRPIGQKICVVVGHGAQDVQAQVGPSVLFVHQKKLLGTADAVKTPKKYFKGYPGDILILCGDVPLLQTATLRQLVGVHRRAKAACTILTARVKNPHGYGRVIRDAHRVPVAICEEKDASLDQKRIREINTGIYVFKSQDLFSALERVKVNAIKKEYYLTDVVAILSKNKKHVQAFVASDAQEGVGINSREDLAEAGAVMRDAILKKLMRQGVTVVDPKTAYIDVGVKIGRDTVIHPCVVIEKNVVIGQKCVIGPFCHIRPGTRIKNGVHLGNFLEISRTQVGAGSLMKHFGFLGDARIGKNVNIGAGTVTANYDGKNKNKTIIQDQAFIGSDTVMVAPVVIGKKAKTGAGCVVTRGTKVPASSVALGVPAKIRAKGKIR